MPAVTSASPTSTDTSSRNCSPDAEVPTMLRRLCLCLLLLLVVSPARAREWKAGVARVAITPERPMWMSGYASRTRPADGTLHDLWAKALVLQDPRGQRCVLLTLDLVGIDRDLSREVCAELEKKYRLPRSAVLL